MAEDTELETQGRQSSPRFPFISLPKALQRAEALREAAGNHPIPVEETRNVWGYAAKSSGGDQTLAALGYYGLIEEASSSNAVGRRVKLTDAAIRYLREERPEVRQELAAAMVQAPKVMLTLWQMWGNDPPSDAIARSILKNDLNFSDSAADQLVAVYRTNLQYFPQVISDKLQADKTAAEELNQMMDVLLKPPAGQKPDIGKVVAETPMRHAVFAIPAGDVTITFPRDLDAQGFEDLEDYFALFIKQQKRQRSSSEPTQ